MKRRPSAETDDAPGFVLHVAPAFAESVRALGLVDAAAWDDAMARCVQVVAGRGRNQLLPLPDGTGTLRLRPGHRGGVLGGLLRDRTLSRRRVVREFALWQGLYARGLPLPVPVLAAARRHTLFWRTAIGTIDLARAQDGVRLLEAAPAEPRLAAAGDAMARTLRRFHDAGTIHGDLHLGNLLFEELDDDEGPETIRCRLIDLDRARRVARVSPADRMRDWMRLARSVEKRGLRERIPRRLWARWLGVYCAGDAGLERDMLACLPRERRRLRRHRLGWRIARALRGVGRSGLAAGLAGLLAACSAESPDAPGRTDQLEPLANTRFSLLAVGDTGRTRAFAGFTEGQLAVSKAMTDEARARPVEGVVLLGDNFYWDGLDREHLLPRLRQNLVRPYCYFLRLDGTRSAEVEGACGLEAALRRPVPIFAVLGNHDVEQPESVQLQREVVPHFLPDWRMARGLAEVVELGSGISLILFESEPAIDDPEAIGRAITSAVRAARGPWRILATHRPIATDDLGNRRLGGYPDFVRQALAAAGRPVQLVLAAHHHSLQAFEVGAPTPSLQVGIGSGARAEPPLALNHPDARFGRLALGFARVDLVGHGDDERLAVSLIQTPSLPILSGLVDAARVARFEVDLAGRLVATRVSGPAFEPGQSDDSQGPRERD